MSKFWAILRASYLWIIIAVFYIPILVFAIWSFSKPKPKIGPSWSEWNGFSTEFWTSNSNGLGSPLFKTYITNTILLAVIVAFLVIVLSLLVVFGLWRQKSIYRVAVESTSNIPFINPDVITAFSLGITFTAMFGYLNTNDNGMMRAIIGHLVMILPFGIMIMYPRSAKFKASLFEASKDLGYGPFKTWFKTYFRYMLPVIVPVFGISLALSFDDYIISRLTSNYQTVGTMLYSGNYFPGWGLALGTIMMLIILSAVTGVSVYVVVKDKRKTFKNKINTKIALVETS